MGVILKPLTWVIIVLVSLVAIKSLADAYADWRYGDDLIAALNEAAKADTTRMVLEDSLSGMRVWQRRAQIATDAAMLLEKELEAETELRRRQGLKLKQVTEVNARLVSRVERDTTGRQDGDSLRVDLNGSDGPVLYRGDVVIAAKTDPPNPYVRYRIEVDARLRLRERILRDPDTGAIFTEVTSPDRQVSIQGVETVVDKSLADLSKRGPFSITVGGLAVGLTAGTVAGVLVCLAVCP